jgi:hypothetical protein
MGECAGKEGDREGSNENPEVRCLKIVLKAEEAKVSMNMRVLKERPGVRRPPSVIHMLTPVGHNRQGLIFENGIFLLLARVIGWINVSYPEWPLRLNLNDGGTAYPTVVVHFGRCFDVSARR